MLFHLSLSAAAPLFSLLGKCSLNAKLNDDHQNAILQNILYWGKGYQTPSETLLNRCQKISRSSYETIKRKNSILTSSLLFLPSPASSLPLSSLSPSFGGSKTFQSLSSRIRRAVLPMRRCRRDARSQSAPSDLETRLLR